VDFSWRLATVIGKRNKDFSPHFEEDVYSISVESSLAARNVSGGTAPAQVDKALTRAKSVTGRIFTRNEKAENHCQIGNIGLALKEIVDWIQQKT